MHNSFDVTLETQLKFNCNSCSCSGCKHYLGELQAMVNPSRNRQHRPQSWTRVASETQTAIWQSVTDLPLPRACCPSISIIAQGLRPLVGYGHATRMSWPSLPMQLSPVLALRLDGSIQCHSSYFHTSALCPLCASVQPMDLFHIEHFHRG